MGRMNSSDPAERGIVRRMHHDQRRIPQEEGGQWSMHKLYWRVRNLCGRIKLFYEFVLYAVDHSDGVAQQLGTVEAWSNRFKHRICSLCQVKRLVCFESWYRGKYCSGNERIFQVTSKPIHNYGQFCLHIVRSETRQRQICAGEFSVF